MSFRIDEFVNKAQLDEVFISPIDLYLDEHSNAVQPDILYISNKNTLRVDKEGLHGIPDLIIEVLSPGNKDHDKITKKALYEKFGVREYWVVDPETRLAIDCCLQGQFYTRIGEFEGEIRSVLLDKVFTY